MVMNTNFQAGMDPQLYNWHTGQYMGTVAPAQAPVPAPAPAPAPTVPEPPASRFTPDQMNAHKRILAQAMERFGAGGQPPAPASTGGAGTSMGSPFVQGLLQAIGRMRAASPAGQAPAAAQAPDGMAPAANAGGGAPNGAEIRARLAAMMPGAGGGSPFAQAMSGGGGMPLTAPGAIPSSIAFKEALAPADAFLPRIEKLAIPSWVYKPEFGDPSRHIGVIAEQFHMLFGVGVPNMLNPIDGIGVALLGVQELYRKVQALAARLENAHGKSD